MQRRATTAVALMLGIVSAPAALVAQTRSGPAPDTPKLLVAVFSSPDNASGVQVANAVRLRIANNIPIRQLYAIPWENIDQYLKSSGYKADSALGPADLKELAKLLRADEVVMGSVSKVPTGLRVEARLARSTDISQGQPLVDVVVTNPADAARPIERSLMEARKQLQDVQACENGLRDQKLPIALASAKAALVKFPPAVIARLCLTTAFLRLKQPDSAIKTIDEIRKLDPKNSFVHRLAFQAYTDKGDSENALRSLLELWRLEPSNQSLQIQIVQELVKMNKPMVAIPIVDTMLSQNPGDPSLLKQKWYLTLAAASGSTDTVARANLLNAAMQAGEHMVRADSTTADTNYFSRQLAAATAAGAWPKAVEYASRATQKYPNNAEFWWLRSRAEQRVGQSAMMQQSLGRLLTINPKYPNATLALAQSWVDMNMPDSAVMVARRAVGAGEDPKTWGPFLMQPANAMLKEAQRDKDIPKFRRVLTLAQESDRLSPTKESKFFIGVSSYFIANEALMEQAKPLLDQSQKTENQRTRNQLYARACPFLKDAGDHLLLIQMNMAQGGAVDPGTAQQILGWAGSVSEYHASASKAACR